MPDVSWRTLRCVKISLELEGGTECAGVCICGVGSYRAAANGDPACLDIFHEPKMYAFGGKLTVIVQWSETAGDVVLAVKAKGLKSATLTIQVK